MRRPIHPDVSRQPDGDKVEKKMDGFAFSDSYSLDINESIPPTDWFDTDGWATIEILINCDTTSAPDGLVVEYTNDVQADTPTVQASRNKEFTIQDANRGFAVYEFPVLLDGFRIKYTNNGKVATDVDIFVSLRTQETEETNQYVGTNSLGQEFLRVGSTSESTGIKIGEPTSLFGDLTTIERSTVVDLTSSFGTSIVRDEIISTGSGSITQDPDPATGEIVLSTGTTPDSTIDLRSASYGRYIPGYSAQAGLGIRIDTLPTEGEVRWGYFDESNGFYWGYDPDQGELFVARREDGVEVERVTQSNFNGFDADEFFSRDFVLDEGNIFQIDFSWYAYGIINFKVVSQTQDVKSSRTPKQETATLHSFAVRQDTSTADPNQPITVQAENGANGEDVQVRIGGRQFSVFGELPDRGRLTAETNPDGTYADGAWSHIMSWRRRNGSTGLEANARLDIEDLDFGANESVKLAIVINADITTNNFSLPSLTPAGETALEVSIDETFNGIGNGTKVWEGSVDVPGTGVAEADIRDVDINIGFGQNNVVSLIAQGIGGSGTSISTMRLLEDF